MFNSDALKGTKQKIRDVQDKQKTDTRPDKAKLVEYWGIVLGSVKDLSTAPINGESKTDQVACEEKLSKRFKRKLERIQKSLKDEGERGLAACEGAGILMCNAFAAAGRAVWEGGETATSDWIRKKCTISNFKEEISFVEIVFDLSPLWSAKSRHVSTISTRLNTVKQMSRSGS